MSTDERLDRIEKSIARLNWAILQLGEQLYRSEINLENFKREVRLSLLGGRVT